MYLIFIALITCFRHHIHQVINSASFCCCSTQAPLSLTFLPLPQGSMEECSSVRSTDSAGTSEEYEIVESEQATVSTPQQDHPLEPTLNIANNGNMEDLRLELTEVCDPLCPLAGAFLPCCCITFKNFNSFLAFFLYLFIFILSLFLRKFVAKSSKLPFMTAKWQVRLTKKPCNAAVNCHTH